MVINAGLCGACQVHDAKRSTDWDVRERELRALLDRHRRRDGRPDVLVPGSGGKDSVYAAHVLKARYGMHPLTVTWAPHEYTDVGRRNFYRWLELGLDNLLVTPNPRVHRALTRLAFLNLLHPFQPFILGQRSLAPKIAAAHGIKLVFFGEDDSEYEGAPGWQEKTESGLKEIHLGGVHWRELRDKHGLTLHDMDIYLPGKLFDLDKFEVHALGHYLRWDPEEAYYYAVEHAGFEANEERTEGTFTKFNSIDDKLDPLHYFTAYTKFGVGRASHDASMEIRHGRMTRAEGVALVQKYDHEIPHRTIGWACGYMGINEAEFWATIQRFKRDYPVVA